jgi:capsular exopolysaccharide synthesis family protein
MSTFNYESETIKMEQQYNWKPQTTFQKTIKPVVPDLPFQVNEAINALRGNIQLSGYDLKLISVTSAVEHEGKSFTAFRLAQSFAALHKKTIYLDCDIRASLTMARYQIEDQVNGLTEFLCGTVPAKDIIYGTEDKWMDVVLTGAVAPNPSELLSSPQFDVLLKFLREKYEYVIVDVPPANAVIDGTLVSKKCDGTILVLECGRTDRNQAQRAKRQLEYAGVKLLGVVLNKVGQSNNKYG